MNLHQRNAQIVSRFERGEDMQSIGRSLGLTRERVRQIVMKAGCVASRKQARARHEKLADLANEGLTNSEIASRTGTTPASVSYALRRTGTAANRLTLSEEIKMMSLAAKVRAGESIWSAAGHDKALAQRLNWYCHTHGIASRPGRWRDFEARKSIVMTLRGAGATWNEVAKQVSVVERRPVQAISVCMWASRHLELPREQREKRSRPPAVGRVAVEKKETLPPLSISVPDGLSLREACVALRGQGSASAIAKLLGVTRNAVIGHWFRARNGRPERAAV